jgi:DNA-binding beta-propeller fold protein YncE
MKKSLIIIFNLILFFSLVTFAQAVEEYEFLRKWSTNKDTWQNPTGVAVDKDGNVYVAGQQKIVKYTRDGTYVFHIENIPNSEDFYFSSHEMKVAVDNSGYIYVSLWNDFMIVKFDPQGDYVTKWDSWDDGGIQSFSDPGGLAIDDSDNVYVCDSGNHRIVKFNSSGGFLAAWGRTGGEAGGADGEFHWPVDIAIFDSSNIYVMDQHNQRVQVFNDAGTFQRKWGDYGIADGKFKYPQGIAVDFEGNVYTVDPDNNNRITKFSSIGTLIVTSGPSSGPWGKYGDDNYHFHNPRDVAVDYSGNVIIADQNNNRIIEYKRVGAPTVEITNPVQNEFVKLDVTISANVTVPGGYTISNVEFYKEFNQVKTLLGTDFSAPFEQSWTATSETKGPYTLWAIATNNEGAKTREKVSVIVAWGDDAPTCSITNPSNLDEIRDPVNIQASASDDNGITKVEFYVDDVKVGEDTDNTDSTYVYTWDTTTVNDGEKEIKVIAYDAIGQFTSDTITVTVKNQEEIGYITKWYTDNPSDVVLDSDGNLYVSGNSRIKKYAPDGTYISTIQHTGSEDFGLDWYFFIAIDNSGNIYACNEGSHNIVKFDSDGNYVTKWGSFGEDDDQFHNPQGIACDSAGNVYVSDQNNHRISKFSSTGTFITSWGTQGGGDGQFNNPMGIAIDASDNVYVADRHNGRVQVFTSNGTFQRKWSNAGSGENHFDCPRGIALDSLGNFYISDDCYHRILKFASDGTFITQWGSSGSGDLQFYSPGGLAVDADFYVYVADRNNNRVVKFRSTWLPTVAITIPADNAIITAPITIQVTASSAIGISKVEFYINDSYADEDATADPITGYYEYSWDATAGADGTYTLKAIAYNTQDTTQESEEISVVVNKDSSDAPPTVSLTNPAEGDIIRLAATIQADASDAVGGGIDRVEFYVDGIKIGEDTTNPYEYTWDTTTVEDGERVIKVVAFDTIGQNVEESITVTVINHEEFGYLTKWSLNRPSDVVLANDGNLYVAGDHRIAKYTLDGTLISRIENTSSDYDLTWWFYIAVDNLGNIYAANPDEHHITKFDSNGSYVTKWGSYGDGNNQFISPYGIVVDSNGNVYVSDSGNNRISKFSSDGTFEKTWGSSGGNDGLFNSPQGMAIDASNNIYVADPGNNRIQVFSSDGTFIRKWGQWGYEDHQLRNPRGIALDSEGNVYVTDPDNYKVVKFTSDGTFLAKWGTRGSGNLQFECPSGIAVDSDFYVYVADECNSRVIKFNSTWRPTVAITSPADNSVLTISPVPIQVTVSSAIEISKVEFYKGGTKVGEDTDNTDNAFEYDWDTSSVTNGPYTLKAVAYNVQNTAAVSGEIYVIVNNGGLDALPTVSLTNPAEGDIIRLQTTIQADASDLVGMDRVEFYVDDVKVREDTDNTDSTYEYTWDATTVEDGEKVIKVVAFDTIGQNVEESITVTVTNQEEFGFISKWNHNHPTDVTVDKDGNIYIAGSSSISKYTPDGNLLLRIEEPQGADYNLSGWMHVAVDDSGNIYVSNEDRHSVVKFDSNGNYVAQWGSYGGGNNQFDNPRGIAVDSTGNVFVVDHNNHRVSKFNSDGTYLSEWGTQGNSDGQLQHPYGIAIDSSDNFYITDNNNRVSVFNSDGEFLRRWGNHGYADTQFRWPQGIAVDSEGYIYVADTGNYRIVKYTNAGTFVTKWGTQGSGDLQFECPNSIAVDSDFNVYVTDNCNGRVTIIKSTWLPTVEITDPSDNSIVTGTVPIQVSASSAVGISKVEFYIDGAKVGEDIDNTDNTYVYSWITTSGSFPDGTTTIKAIAFNIEGKSIETPEISVIVNNSADVAPTVSITNPLDGEIIRKLVDIEADASDDIGINRVEFYIADTLVSTDTEPPYVYNWDTTTVGDGETEVKAVAYDGIAQNTSDSITATVANQEAYEYISKFNTGDYGHPNSIALDQYGHLYVTFCERIVMFTSTGSFLTEIDNEGSGGNYQLTCDMDIAVDDSGNIYVSNRNIHEITKFDARGNFVIKWGSQGEGDDELNAPEGLAVDSQGNVYVCDADNHRIVKYEPDGTFIDKFGGQGHADGYFQYPVDIALDSENNMYIAEQWNNRIQVLDSNGTFVRKFGNWGYGDGEFQCARGIALDSDGNVYVADECSNRISKFSSVGEFITKWGSYGSGEGQLQNPRDVAIDSSGNVYVADQSNQRIVIFRVIGTPSVEITSPLDNSSVGGSVMVTATAESEFGIDRVEFYIDDVLESSDAESPYIWDWITTSYSNGSHEIKAVAYNTDLKSTETSISAVVNNGGDVAPTVSITNLDDGAVIRGNVLIKAAASDELGVEEVRFYMDETLLTTDEESPYEYSWDTTTVADGEKELKVVAYDTIGQHTWASITVIVDNANNVFSIDLSEAAAIYINAENKLRKIDFDGNINPVINTDPYVEQFQFGPLGNLYIAFRHPQESRDRKSYILMKANPETNEFNGIDSSLTNLVWIEHSTTKNIQFDDQGNIYYFAHADLGNDVWERVLRKYVDEDNIEDIINRDMEIFHWLVRGDGTIVIAGLTRANNEEWLRKINPIETSPELRVENITEPDWWWEWGWMAEFPDNRVYVTLSGSYLNLDGIYRLAEDLPRLQQEDADAPYIGDMPGSLYKIDDLVAGHSQEYTKGIIEMGRVQEMINYEIDDNDTVYGLAGHWYNKYRTVVKLYPEPPMVIEPQLIDRAQAMKVSGNKLVIAGFNNLEGKYKIVLYDPLTDITTDLMPNNNIEIYLFDVQANGSILFHGLDLDTNQNIVAILELASPAPAGMVQALGYGFKELAELGGRPLSFGVFKEVSGSEVVAVSIAYLSSGSTVSGVVKIHAAAASPEGVERVEFYIDGELKTTDSTSAYTYSWDTTEYSDGSHTIKVKVYDKASQTAVHEISVIVNNETSPGEIVLSANQIDFATASHTSPTSDQKLVIENTGGMALNWTATPTEDWIQVSPTSGTGSGIITVSPNTSGLSVGTYTGNITIQDPGASNSPQWVKVNLRIYSSVSVQDPFGAFETPQDGTTGIAGALPVSGWALDDIEVDRVEIWREPVAGESTEANGWVYIGDAGFVEGARPDVAEMYPNYPLCYQAGWGYLLLTNYLPNDGDGTYTLHAVAYDKEGNEADLGSKTISCDNSSASEPFGTIDTPTEGGEASGSTFINFGWALTPQPNSIPTDGSTITVYVNGEELGHPDYGHNRSDVANLFPGYDNTDGAVGYFYLDTTEYSNGVHLISWNVQDSGGNSADIGTRYFTIVNVDATGSFSAGIESHRVDLGTAPALRDVDNLPTSFKSIRVRSGNRRNVKPVVTEVDNYGIANIAIREVERVQVELGEGADYEGYMIVGGALKPLPSGSTLNTEKGTFSWQPGAGFIGEYNFVFIKKDAAGVKTKIKTRITILPKFSVY